MDSKKTKYKDHPYTSQIIACAIEVHRVLGPGLFESAYEHCLAYELERASIPFRRQCSIGLKYKETELEAAYRLDFLVASLIVVELKAVEDINPVHISQTLTYMKLAKAPFGLLLNFNCRLLKFGIRKLVI